MRSRRFHLAGGSPGARPGGLSAAPHPWLPLGDTIGFPSGTRTGPVPACFTVCWFAHSAGRSAHAAACGPPGSVAGASGRAPPTRCETSGYNTGPGRCSDPSCLVLQPEGRRSAAEPAPSIRHPRDSTQRDRAQGGCRAPEEAVGSPPPSLPLVRRQSPGRVPPHPQFASGSLSQLPEGPGLRTLCSPGP